MKPLISIIMNCKNGDRYLEDSLKSIINQTYENWELIFVDNSSTDNSKKIFNRYYDKRFKYFFIENQVNLGSARQIALKNCRGEFVSFLDTDDIWLNKKLEKQIKYFEDQKTGMVISNTIFFSSKKEKIFYYKAPPTGKVFFNLLKQYFISLETLICRKACLDKISFQFDKEYSMISDMDLTLRLSLISELSYCPEVLSKWRVHDESDTWNKKNLFFLEKLNLIEKLSLIGNHSDNKIFLKNKKKFIEKTNFSLSLNYIENEDNIVIEEIKKNLKKKMKFTDRILLLILFILPFSKNFIKLYRKMFSINP